jgi:hypothetical protein
MGGENLREKRRKRGSLEKYRRMYRESAFAGWKMTRAESEELGVEMES